jgi:hypothetical protein
MGRIEVPIGTTLVRGTKYMNCDVAALLDEQYEKQKKNASRG